MAGRYVLVVSNNEKSFAVNTLCEAFKASDVDTRSVTFSDRGLAELIASSIGVLIVGSYGNSFILTSIQKKCVENKKRILLYGNAEEIEAVKSVIKNKKVIYCELERPIETEEVIKGVKKLMSEPEPEDLTDIPEPAKPAEPANPTATREAVRTEAALKKVLVVDDNGVMLRTIMGWLEGKYAVSLANSAATAAVQIEKSIPDLILPDYEMPVCSGAEFMEQLSKKEKTKDIPIIFLTSRCDANTVKEVLKLKPKGYILKTTPEEQLLKTIADFFA